MSGLEASLVLIGVLLGVMALLGGAGLLAFYLTDRFRDDRRLTRDPLGAVPRDNSRPHA
jgi:hypothetical protein